MEGRVAAEAMQAYAKGYAAGQEDGRRLWRRTAWCSMAFTAVTFGALVVAVLERVPS